MLLEGRKTWKLLHLCMFPGWDNSMSGLSCDYQQSVSCGLSMKFGSLKKRFVESKGEQLESEQPEGKWSRRPLGHLKAPLTQP